MWTKKIYVILASWKQAMTRFNCPTFLSSMSAMQNDSGDYTYSALGEIQEQTGPDLNRITYTARESLGDSLGFYYYRNRVMDPTTGRFISEDPLGFIDGPNRYVYVVNNPMLYTDPEGLWSWKKIGGGLSIFAGIRLIKSLCNMSKKIDEEAEEKKKIENDETLDDIEKELKIRELIRRSIDTGAISQVGGIAESTTGLLNPIPCP